MKFMFEPFDELDSFFAAIEEEEARVAANNFLRTLQMTDAEVQRYQNRVAGIQARFANIVPRRRR